jgi:glucuronoarabinoxylan endo-1,4-beta-xylanase
MVRIIATAVFPLIAHRRQPIHFAGNRNVIKSLLLMVVLLVPELTYGGNPSADLSVEVVPAATATIQWDAIYQTIDGFGASNVDNTGESQYDTLFFQTLGYSLMRASTPTDGSCTSISLACANNGSGNIADFQTCLANGCRAWATSWAPPAAYSTNGSTNCVDNGGGGTLSPAHYQDFANYLSNYIASLDQYYNITLYAISPQNEPTECQDYGSSLWPDWLFDTFIKNYLGPTMQNNGQLASTMIAMPESDSYAHITGSSDTCMNDPSCAAYVGVLDYHGYDGDGPNPYPSSGKLFWQTENSGLNGTGPNAPGCTPGVWCNTISDGMMWAGIYDTAIAVDEVEAWEYWQLTDTDQEGLVNTSTGEISIRAYILGNYAKYIRPGFVMIGATHDPQNGVTVSAYKNSATGAFAIVATNQDTSDLNQTFTFTGVSPSSVTPTITSASQKLQDLSAVPISGGSFTYTLPAQSVITFHSP